MEIKQISSKKIYQNKWLSVREDTVIFPDGRQGTYSVVERPPVNFIIAADENGNIAFVHEYRYPIGKAILQLPAGTAEPSENMLTAAKRELLQETGIQANTWHNLGRFYIGPGHENVCAYTWLATSLTKPAKENRSRLGTLDEVIIQVEYLSISAIKEKIQANAIECGITLAALNLFFLHIKKGRSE